MQGYEKLDDVLARAFKQASQGKGAERHANDLPFHKQPMQQVANQVGRGFLLGQAIKKLVESQSLSPERAVAEQLGAINYIAGAIIHLEAQNDSQSVQGVSYSDECKEKFEYLDTNFQLVEVTGNMAIGFDWIKVPEGADLYTTHQTSNDLFYRFNGTRLDYYPSDHWAETNYTAEKYPIEMNECHRSVVWSRESLPLTRDQAREVLAKMKRGDSVKINEFNVNFDSFGAFFVTRSDLSPSYHGQSLKATLNHIFPEAK